MSRSWAVILVSSTATSSASLVPPGAKFVEHGVKLHPHRAGCSDLFQRERLELEVEHRFERAHGRRHDLVDAHRASELARDRREGCVLDAAGGVPLGEGRGI